MRLRSKNVGQHLVIWIILFGQVHQLFDRLLEAIIVPEVLDSLPCDSPHEVFTAVAAGGCAGMSVIPWPPPFRPPRAPPGRYS